jgi:predicted phosphodiesterase
MTLLLSGDNTHLGSLGGPIQTGKVISKQKNNGFTDLDFTNSQLYLDEYVCFYAKNSNTTEHIKNFTAYIEFQPTPNQYQNIKISLGSSDKNGEEQTIVSKTVPPKNMTWKDAATFAGGILLGDDFAPGDTQAFWIWRRNRPNTMATKGNKFRLVLAGDPPQGSSSGGSGDSGGSGGGSGTGGGGGGTTPPPDPTPVDVKIGKASDISCGSTGDQTISNLISENCDFYILTGDLSTEDSSDCFVDAVSSIANKIYVAFGNHDREEGTPQPELTNEYLDAFNLPNTYYGVIDKGVLFVAIDSFDDYQEGSTQYNFIKTFLENNKTNSAVHWRIMGSHELFWTMNSDHGANDSLRQAYWPLAQDNGIDLILHGHNHNYQRSFPVKIYQDSNGDYDPDQIVPVATDKEPNYTKGATGDLKENEHFIIVGPHGGQSSRDSISGSEDWAAESSSSFSGYGIIEITEAGKKLTWKCYQNNKTLFDVFSITKV